MLHTALSAKRRENNAGTAAAPDAAPRHPTLPPAPAQPEHRISGPCIQLRLTQLTTFFLFWLPALVNRPLIYL